MAGDGDAVAPAVQRVVEPAPQDGVVGHAQEGHHAVPPLVVEPHLWGGGGAGRVSNNQVVANLSERWDGACVGHLSDVCVCVLRVCILHLICIFFLCLINAFVGLIVLKHLFLLVSGAAAMVMTRRCRVELQPCC